MRYIVVSILAASMGSGGALAQTPPASAPGDVVVVGRPLQPQTLRKQAEIFAADLGRPSGYDQLARWRSNYPLCVRTVGLIPAADQAIRKAVEHAAERLGIAVQSIPCNADVVVIGTDNPVKAMAVVEKVVGSLANEEGQAAEHREIAKPAPVRWWRVRHRGLADGRDPVDDPRHALQYNVYDSSHLRTNTRENVDNVVVLVDGPRVMGASVEALADYVAMGVFAALPAPPHVPDSPSILALFEPGGGVAPGSPEQMTDWDRAYLKGLYDADPSAQTMLQNGQIATTMKRALSQPEVKPTTPDP